MKNTKEHRLVARIKTGTLRRLIALTKRNRTTKSALVRSLIDDAYEAMQKADG